MSEQTREKLSVVVLTKNEEHRIVPCLKSVRWADEIIVVDDLSTDRTPKICQDLGAKVFSHKSDGDFRQQRNLGIDNAQGNWILQMDADEIVPENLKVEIQRRLAEDSEFSGFQFRRKNFFLGHFMRYGGFYEPYSLKLFKKSQGRYIGDEVHETVQVEGEIGIIAADIEHYPFQSITQFIARADFYTALEARQMLEEDKILDEKKIRYNLTIRPLKRFWKLYVRKKAYKDGMYGLIFAMLFTFGPLLTWMKYWELVRNGNAGNLSGQRRGDK